MDSVKEPPQALDETRVCPGSSECGIDKCYHYEPHEHTAGCENGCFNNTGCIRLTE